MLCCCVLFVGCQILRVVYRVMRAVCCLFVCVLITDYRLLRVIGIAALLCYVMLPVVCCALFVVCCSLLRFVACCLMCVVLAAV